MFQEKSSGFEFTILSAVAISNLMNHIGCRSHELLTCAEFRLVRAWIQGVLPADSENGFTFENGRKYDRVSSGSYACFKKNQAGLNLRQSREFQMKASAILSLMGMPKTTLFLDGTPTIDMKCHVDSSRVRNMRLNL